MQILRSTIYISAKITTISKSNTCPILHTAKLHQPQLSVTVSYSAHTSSHGTPYCLPSPWTAVMRTSSSSRHAAGAASAATRAARPPRRRRRRGQKASSSFECRTCGREFSTFQALGGHRTSHLRRPATTTKKKTRSSKPVLVHACAACGLGFSTGQALGGHMRRHRGGPSSTTATEQERGCGGPDDFYDVDLSLAVVLHERPSSASLQLLDLFV